MCTLCRAAPAESPSTTCPRCSAGLPGQLSPPLLDALTRNALRAIGGDDEARKVRKAALAVRCPACKAGPGSDCTRPSHGGAARTKALHPSRLEAAAGPRAA